MTTEILRPNAAGDECNINLETGAACPNHYQNVDEIVADGITTMNKTSWATYLRDLYNLEAGSGVGVVTQIEVFAKVRGASSVPGDQASLKIAIKSGTGSGAPDTVTEDTARTLTITFDDYSRVWATNPATAAAWTWAEIHNLQAGVALREPNVSTTKMSNVTQVWVVVTSVVAGRSFGFIFG